jgi:hypothetical protein
MHEFSVRKDMNFFLTMMKGGGNGEGGDAFMSNTNYQVEQDRVVTTLNIINTLNIILSVVSGG